MLPEDFTSTELIQKGWSGDRKYCATDAQGNRFLLRLSPKDTYARKLEEFQSMRKAEALDIPMCRPLEFGTRNGEVYTIQTWIDGEDAQDVIPSLEREKQYDYGLEAGRILRKIHQIPAPAGTEEWEGRFNRKADRKIRQYETCPIKIENGQAFVDYINSHRHLLHGRPLTYQHGDYHIGNMMIGRDGKLYIIDFDRYDYGDPWEEFNRIVWCAQAAPAFAAGIVEGYFEGAVPLDFWELLALYISSNTLSAVPWAIPYGQEEVRIALEQARDVLRWYDNMRNPIPTWYREGLSG